MKKLIIVNGIFAMLLLGCNNAGNMPASSKETVNKKDTAATTKPAEATKPAMPDSATMMKNWQNYMAVSDMQKMMASWNGAWSGDITIWEHPGATPQKIKGNTVNKMILGGRYQVSTSTSTMMGMPFEGQSTLAFDNAKKLFISTWIDNMGTGVMILKGHWDSATKSINLSGSMVEPGTGDDISVRETLTIIDAKTQLMEMFVTGPDGKEYKNMEIKYSKK